MNNNYIIAIAEDDEIITNYYEKDLNTLDVDDVLYCPFMINANMVDVWNQYVKNNADRFGDRPCIINKEMCEKWLCCDRKGNIIDLNDRNAFKRLLAALIE